MKLTGLGQRFILFLRESKIELQKVVWPTRQETLQTTAIVMVMVSIVGSVLWLSDGFITFCIAHLAHLG